MRRHATEGIERNEYEADGQMKSQVDKAKDQGRGRLVVAMSGGVDSSTVVGLMAAELDAPVRTYTIGFPESAYDEREYARAVADRFGTEARSPDIGQPSQ